MASAAATLAVAGAALRLANPCGISPNPWHNKTVGPLPQTGVIGFKLTASATRHTSTQGSPGEAGAFGEAAQFGPGEVRMDPAAEAAIGAGDDVLATDDLGIAQDAVGDELRVLDEVSGGDLSAPAAAVAGDIVPRRPARRIAQPRPSNWRPLDDTRAAASWPTHQALTARLATIS
jgi:hypothetical protein